MNSTQLVKQINEIIDSKVKIFLRDLSGIYNLDEEQLQSIWKIATTTVENTTTPVENETPEKLYNKMKKNELIELIKERGLVAGKSMKKEQLIKLLIEGKPTPQEKSKLDKKGEKILDTILKKKCEIFLTKNQFNNFEHKDTTFVFNSKNKKVIGKQNQDGSINPLTQEDIELCDKYKFQYEIPENLDEDDEEIGGEDVQEIQDMIDDTTHIMSDDDFEIEEYDEDE